jgi:transposase
MSRSGVYPQELRERAVRMVAEVRPNYESDWAAITAVAARLGVGTAETLRKWVRQAQVDAGRRPGVTTEESVELRRLRAEVRELRRANEILKAGGCRTNRSAPVAARPSPCEATRHGTGWWARASAVYARRQSLSRLCVVQMSVHSLATAASPRRERLRICRLCLICPKIGSMVAARFL